MIPSYSVAEARNRFAELLHELECVPEIEVTRRGRRVALLISAEEFERLRAGNITFWNAYTAFRSTFDLAQAGIEPEVFEGLREQSPGREISW